MTTTRKQPDKILVIRMVSAGDALAIGLPAIRYFQQQLADAELHVLSYGEGQKLLELAEPQLRQLTLAAWPDDFFQAMEAFLGLAEQIIGQAYSQIINLDTAFMPCFLARFLQDAGEPVRGNSLSKSIQQLLDEVRAQSLQAEYVNNPAAYLHSSFIGMSRWQRPWWQSDYVPDGGYPEYYLKQCCGFSRLEMDLTIQLPASTAEHTSAGNLIALEVSQSEDGYAYPYPAELTTELSAKGYTVWQVGDYQHDNQALLARLQQSKLLISKASAIKWLADAVGCPTLMISGAAEPKLYMPDYATDVQTPCPRHSHLHSANSMVGTFACHCDDPQELADNIVALLTDKPEESSHA